MTLRVAGTERAAIESALRARGDGLVWREVEPRLEDVFIRMLSASQADA